MPLSYTNLFIISISINIYKCFCFILESAHIDDNEDDPEYNVLCDDEFTNGNYKIT